MITMSNYQPRREEIEKRFGGPERFAACLTKMYWHWGMGANTISGKLGVSDSTLREGWFPHYKIRQRTTSRARKLGHAFGTYGTKKPSREELRRKIVDEEKSYRTLAAEYGVSRQTIGDWAHSDDIKTRTNTAASKLAWKRKMQLD